MDSAARLARTCIRARAILALALLVGALLGTVALLPPTALAAGLGEQSAIRQAPAGADGGPITAPPLIPQTTGICPGDAPVKAASTEEGDRLFYVPNDPVYEAIIPEACFPSEGAAAGSGFKLHGY